MPRVVWVVLLLIVDCGAMESKQVDVEKLRDQCRTALLQDTLEQLVAPGARVLNTLGGGWCCFGTSKNHSNYDIIMSRVPTNPSLISIEWVYVNEKKDSSCFQGVWEQLYMHAQSDGALRDQGVASKESVTVGYTYRYQGDVEFEYPMITAYFSKDEVACAQKKFTGKVWSVLGQHLSTRSKRLFLPHGAAQRLRYLDKLLE